MSLPALTDQVALVTGAGRGLGRAIAQTLARAGARVALIARSAPELAETARLIAADGARGQAFPVDVTDAKVYAAPSARSRSPSAPWTCL